MLNQAGTSDVLVTIGVNTYPLLVSLEVINVTNSTGVIDARPLPTGGNLSWTADVRLHFTLQGSTALGSACNSVATATINTANSDLLSLGWSSNPYDDSTGEALIFEENITFPGWASTGCNGNGSQVDGALGFAGSSGGVTSLRWGVSITDYNGSSAIPTGS